MIVPSAGSTVTALIAGLEPRPGGGGGAAGSVAVGASVATCVGTLVGAVAACSLSPPHDAKASAAAITLARARGSSRTGEPRAAGGHLDRTQQVAQEARLGVGILGMAHCGVHRAAAIVAVAPRERTRRVQRREHVRGGR